MRISTMLTVAVLCLVSAFGAHFLGWHVAAPIAAAPLASPRQDGGPGSQQCSARTLHGSYGLRFEGTKIGVGPYVSVSRITFDGQGQFTTNEVGRSNGALVQRTFTGAYVVNGDCTGYLNFSSNLTNPPHVAFGNFVIVDEGKEFYVLDNEDGWAASGIAKRI